ALRRPHSHSLFSIGGRVPGDTSHACYAATHARRAKRDRCINAVESAPRIALLADTYYEVNGAARTCREWEAFARERELPFFCVRLGKRQALCAHGPVWT